MDYTKPIKRRFKLIICGMSLLFIVNMLYLGRLYNSIKNETSKIMTLSIEQADGEELQIRLKELSSLSSSTLSEKESRTISIDKSITTKDEELDHEENKSNSASSVVFSQLMKEVRQTVHQSIDTIIPPNLTLLDSLITVIAQKKGISPLVFYSEVVDLNSSGILATSRTAKSASTKNSYVYEYDTENGYAYKVFTAPMTRSVLQRMSGILLTTLLTIILLGYAFWYFIRTVVRQKTIEEMKQDFTNNMTHELKTPLSVAYSAVDALLNYSQGGDKDKREQYLKICIEQLSNLRDSVDRILSISKEQSQKVDLRMEFIELKPLFMRIAEQQRFKTYKKIDVNISVEPEHLALKVDAIHFFNVISNIIDNSIKYSSENVKISIRAYIEGNNCVILIRDNGLGISKENIKHIFDKFYRVPQGNLYDTKGYGLGLYYVKTMIERHRGEITVKSALKEGTEFIIKMPKE